MNYDLKMQEIIKTINKPKKLLLHACCAPCSSYCLTELTKYFDITIYYYNPNIHPKLEYDRRLNELKKFITEYKGENKIEIIEVNYYPNEYFEKIKGLENLGEKSKRCYECYKFRLEKSVKYAKDHEYDYFTTTLSISPYKVSSWINEIGELFQEEYNINYLYADFKKRDGYKKSLELSKKFNLYRQDYCGCIYSKEERISH